MAEISNWLLTIFLERGIVDMILEYNSMFIVWVDGDNLIIDYLVGQYRASVSVRELISEFGVFALTEATPKNYPCALLVCPLLKYDGLVFWTGPKTVRGVRLAEQVDNTYVEKSVAAIHQEIQTILSQIIKTEIKCCNWGIRTIHESSTDDCLDHNKSISFGDFCGQFIDGQTLDVGIIEFIHLDIEYEIRAYEGLEALVNILQGARNSTPIDQNNRPHKEILKIKIPCTNFL